MSSFMCDLPRHCRALIVRSVPLFFSVRIFLLETLKHIVTRYTGFVWAMLKPLGSWAVFAIAGIDSAFFGFPLDPVVASYVYQDRPRFLLYAVMASAGSAVGCIILYLIGYKGGEVLLEKRISRTKFNKIRSLFDRHEFRALMFSGHDSSTLPVQGIC